ncbi:glycosyl hydrolase [Dysgonomonas sp. 25]|uniref:glycosyl hydrolase n=1 Tax=Dysgonomonas sp. 25 TaxID=2302933 RepID=UPI0013D3C1DF|nr:glycosyl hydrolase [Dysgonomonas sp. 25]NDV67322.1 glycosyl hydrolase [Dysgonomonas sp. 25]
MKKIYTILLLACICWAYSCNDGSLSHGDVNIPDPVEENDEDDGISSEPTTTAVIKLLPGDSHKHQVIDGFGCSFAGWANVTYLRFDRETMIEDLFGENGLRLNICRGAVYEHYTDITTFGMDREYNMQPDHPSLLNTWYTDNQGSQTNQLAQMWITDHMLRKYKNVKFIFSTWSPPTQWKSGSSVNNTKFPEIADYLVDFMKAYTGKFDMDIYAISPTNEPLTGGTGWGGCRWTEADLANFCHNYLRPTMDQNGFGDVKLILGEHPWWKNGVTYLNKMLDNQPDLVDDNVIAAAHGYSTTDENIIPCPRYENEGVPIWQTEVSDDRRRDESWNDAMKWAKTINTYFTVANTNAFLWWAGGRSCSSTGENLLQFNDDSYPSSGYYKVNRYYTLGHFSRYIPVGSHRVDVEAIPTLEDPIPADLHMSAYVKDNTYTIVLVNYSQSESFSALLEVEGEEYQNMVSYTSDDSKKWYRKKLNPSLSGLRSVTVPSYSVVTITGKLKTTE